MIDIILGILCFNLILVFFKLFTKFKVDTLQAIVFNYFTAGLLGLFFSEKTYSISELIASPWFYYAVSIGLLFISVFYLLAKGAQVVGMAISTVANKMSVIIPVIAAIFLYGDHATVFKIAGIILALIGVFLTSTDGKKLSFDKKYLWLILIIFFGQGIADIIFNYAQQEYVQAEDAKIFFTVMFFSAGLGGTLLAAKKIIRKENKFQIKSILWGLAVGIPNYLTLLFFFNALEDGQFESSQIYPIFNIGIVLMSSIIGFIIFKEKLKTSNWMGIGLSILAIALISLS